MRMWKIYYKGGIYHVENAEASAAVMDLKGTHPELANKENWYIQNWDLTNGSITIVLTALGVYRFPALPKQDEVPESDRNDISTGFASSASMVLDGLASALNRDLIKQQIDEALAKGDFEKCRELSAKLYMPKEEMV